MPPDIESKMGLEPRQLNDLDESLLDLLASDRSTPKLLRSQLRKEMGDDVPSAAYINQRLRRLEEHDHLNNLEGTGVYEAVDDPRNDIHEDDAGGAGEVPGEPGGYTDAGLEIDDDQDIEVRIGASPEEAAKLKTRIENLEASREEIVEERDELQERVDELEEQRRGDAIDVDRVRTALDDVEAAAERGDGQALREAIERAREVLDDA